MRKFFILLLLLAMPCLFAVPVWAGEDEALPIPRFVALKSSEVNMRTGPGVRYPIKWVFTRKYLPVEVVDEFEQWRKVKDYLGEEGWVHQSMLSGKRMIAVMGDEPQLVYHRPEYDSPPVFRTEPGVLGELVSCKRDWCYVSIDGLKGWMPKETIFGVYKDEVFE